MKDIKENLHNDFERLKEDKETYFDNFYNNNYNIVYRICYSILKNKENSEDMSQCVFEKIFKLDFNKLPSDHEASWLYTVAKNECLQFIRKSKSELTDEYIENLENDKNEIDDFIDDEDYNKLVKKLNKKQEQIVKLKVISEFTFKEIGQILSMPTATVQWYYYNSIKSLKLALTNLTIFIVSFIVSVKANEEKYKDRENEEIYYSNKDSSKEISSDSGTQHVQGDYTVLEGMSTNIGRDYDSYSQSTSQDVTSGIHNIFHSGHGIYIVPAIFFTLTVVFFIIFAKHESRRKKGNS